MNSARLPGKVLMDFAGMPMVLWIFRRAQRLNMPIALACSRECADDALEEVVRSAGFPVYRGELDDVLARAIAAAAHFSWTHFARLCADRPFFNVDEMRTGLAIADNQPGLDLISNNLSGQAQAGLSTEIIRVAALKQAAQNSAQMRHREHLSAYIYDHPSLFQTYPLTQHALPAWLKTQRFAVDTLADYRRLSLIAKNFTPDIALESAFQSERAHSSHEQIDARA